MQTKAHQQLNADKNPLTASKWLLVTTGLNWKFTIQPTSYTLLTLPFFVFPPCAHTWSEILFWFCTICLEQSLAKWDQPTHSHLGNLNFKLSYWWRVHRSLFWLCFGSSPCDELCASVWRNSTSKYIIIITEDGSVSSVSQSTSCKMHCWPLFQMVWMTEKARNHTWLTNLAAANRTDWARKTTLQELATPSMVHCLGWPVLSFVSP